MPNWLRPLDQSGSEGAALGDVVGPGATVPPAPAVLVAGVDVPPGARAGGDAVGGAEEQDQDQYRSGEGEGDEQGAVVAVGDELGTAGDRDRAAAAHHVVDRDPGPGDPHRGPGRCP